MGHKRALRICFMGGSQAGVIGALTVLAKGDRIISAVSYSKYLTDILKLCNIPLRDNITNKKFMDDLKKSDLLLSVHGRDIVRPELLKLPKLGAINVHPYLYKYKGANPIERALKDGEFKASVGVHVMKKEVDSGKVLVEEFVDVSPAKSVDEIYNKLYPYYCSAVLKALDMVRNG